MEASPKGFSLYPEAQLRGLDFTSRNIPVFRGDRDTRVSAIGVNNDYNS